MPAITDLFGKASVDTDHSVATTVTADRTAGVTVLSCFDLSTFTEDTPVYFVTYTKTTDPVTGEVTITDTVSWKGLVNAGANTITNLTVAPGYVDAGNVIGQFVECIPTSYWSNELIDGIQTEHNPDGTHGDVTADSVAFADGTGIIDENGNEQIKFETTASAVNEVSVKNAATDGTPEVKVTGGDTNIDLSIKGKGTGHPALHNVVAFRVGATSATSLGAGGWTIINLATEAYDYGDNFSSSIFTAPFDGIYAFTGALTLTAGAAGEDYITGIFVNGGESTYSSRVRSGAAGANTFPFATELELSAGDEVTFRGYNGSGGGKSVVTNAISTWFAGHLIGRTD